MLRARNLILGVLVQMMALCSACLAVQLSADMTITTMGPRPGVTSGKVYISGLKLRMEFETPNGTVVMIGENNKTKRTYLLPQHMLFFHKVEEPPDEVNDSYLIKIADKKALGEEIVGGHRCKKALYTRRDKAGTETRWYSPKWKIPIKFEETRKDLRTGPSGLTVVVEYKNIKAGKIPDSMFKIPGGYTERPMP